MSDSRYDWSCDDPEDDDSCPWCGGEGVLDDECECQVIEDTCMCLFPIWRVCPECKGRG